MSTDSTGIIQIYYGDGKGKTTAAVGQALRAAGNGFTVYFIQFIKDGKGSGETGILKKLDCVIFRAFGTGKFLKSADIREEDRRTVLSGIEHVKNILETEVLDMIILDEIGAVLEAGLINEDVILDFFKRRNIRTNFVLTGRVFPDSILSKGDIVTEMVKKKHHFDMGAQARQGIEF